MRIYWISHRQAFTNEYDSSAVISCISTTKMSQNWSDEETLKLIAIWGENDIQAQINMCKRNSHIYEKIASEMKDAGFDRTAMQCCNKIKKLRGEYRKKDKKPKQVKVIHLGHFSRL